MTETEGHTKMCTTPPRDGKSISFLQNLMFLNMPIGREEYTNQVIKDQRPKRLLKTELEGWLSNNSQKSDPLRRTVRNIVYVKRYFT